MHNLYVDLLIRGGSFLLAFYGILLVFVCRAVVRGWRSTTTQDRDLHLPVAFFLTYLTIENLFDLTFIFSNYLTANFMILCVVWAINLSLNNDESTTRLSEDTPLSKP